MTTTDKNPHAVALGRLGGRAKSSAKTVAVRRNASLGGLARSAKYPKTRKRKTDSGA